jgi:hypothetical protein
LRADADDQARPKAGNARAERRLPNYFAQSQALAN